MGELKAFMDTAGNLGGMAMVAIALLWIHRESLKTFREELKEERDQNSKIHAALLAKWDDHHELFAKSLSHQDDAIDMVHREVRGAREDIARAQWRSVNET